MFFSTKDLEELGSVDHGYSDDRIDKVAEPERRAFTYLMMSSLQFVYASAARLLVVKFVASLSASAEVLAMAFSEFDLSEVELGKTVTVTWRGKPVFIRHRTPAEIAEEAAVPMEVLRDQELDSDRCIKPEFMIVLGICVSETPVGLRVCRLVIFGSWLRSDNNLTPVCALVSLKSLIWGASRFVRPVTLADGSAPATDRTTTRLAASAEDHRR